MSKSESGQTIPQEVFGRTQEPEYLRITNSLVDQIKKDAKSRLRNPTEATECKIDYTIEKRVRPGIEEGQIIGEQLASRRYGEYRKLMKHYFRGVRLAGVGCSDGRDNPLSIFDAKVGVHHKRLQGLPAIRHSDYNDAPVSNDQAISTAINDTADKWRRRKGKLESFDISEITAFEQPAEAIIDVIQRELDSYDQPPTLSNPRHRKTVQPTEQTGEKKPEFVEMFMPHIDSMNPQEKGCGAAAGKIKPKGKPLAKAKWEGLKWGGVDLYHKELGDGFHALDDNVARAGGVGTTVDVTYDTYSQGLIIGDRDAVLNGWFDPNEDLRSNYEALHDDKHEERRVLMTEMLDQHLHPMVDRIMGALHEQLGIPMQLDMKNPHHFADNQILTSLISKAVTDKYEASEEGFAWIPSRIREGKSTNMVRVIAYTALRNSIYRNLNGIKPGEHSLVYHPEQSVRVGPTGPSFNMNNISFTEVTPTGLFTDDNVAATGALYNLAEHYMPELPGDLKADFSKESRVIFVTGKFHKEDFTEEAAHHYYQIEANNVRDNASRIRQQFSEGVQDGDTIVVGGIYNRYRELTNIVTSVAKNDPLH